MSKLKTAVVVAVGASIALLATAANATSMIDAAVLTTLSDNVIDSGKAAAGAGFTVQGTMMGLGIGMTLLGTFIHKGARA